MIVGGDHCYCIADECPDFTFCHEALTPERAEKLPDNAQVTTYWGCVLYSCGPRAKTISGREARRLYAGTEKETERTKINYRRQDHEQAKK